MNHEYTPGLLVRFWAKVDRKDDPNVCWNWTATKNHGYGRIYFDGFDYNAHRVSYELAYGPFPDEMKVLHKCDNPSCVNPHHLFLGTHQDNMTDMKNKGRSKHPCGEESYFHKLTYAKVDEIRRLYAAGNIGQRVLGRMFGVDKSTIADIVHFKIWRR